MRPNTAPPQILADSSTFQTASQGSTLKIAKNQVAAQVIEALLATNFTEADFLPTDTTQEPVHQSNIKTRSSLSIRLKTP